MRALPAILVSVALVASSCSDDAPSASPNRTDPTSSDTIANPLGTDPLGTNAGNTGSGGGQFLRALTPFADCSAFLDHVKAVARDRVGPYGLDGGPIYYLEDDMIMEEMAVDGEATPDRAGQPADEPASEPALPTTSGADSPGAGGGDGSFSGTNVQELGIDEPDIIKTDGERILVASQNQLSYVDISGSEPVLTDQITLEEGWGHELFFLDDRALLFTNGGNWGGPMPVEPMLNTPATDQSGDAEAQFAEQPVEDYYYEPEYYGPAALVFEIDLSDPSNLSISGSMRIEGQYLSARAIGDTVRLAVSSGPNQLPWLYPQSPSGEQRATEANRQIIDESTLEDWIPSYQLTGHDVSDGGPLLACGRMHHPAEFSGFEVISVLDLDLSSGLADSFDPNDAVGVLAGGQTVYSSNERFYVATTKWAGADLADDQERFREWSDDYETDLHAFAIAPGEPTQYVASGTVRGSLLNQFSLDEYQGYLRVIGTDGSPWDDRNQSETRLVVLDERGDQLVQVGEVGGIGKGEQLFSARLMDDIGFAVTFRQTDPFYVLDLSEPTNPQIAGELKIPGVSTYLHPIGDQMVLGIGQDATEDGFQTGLKLSLFDVSDPADPREVSVWTMPNSNSPAEWDHRAFQMFGSTAILPVQDWNNQSNGVILFEIGETITEIGRVSHVDDEVDVASDCRVLTTNDVPVDSELWWMANEPSIRFQLCDADNRGGWGNDPCETIPVDDIRYWFGDESVSDEVIATLGAAPDDRFEICYPDDYYQEQIQRSLVANGVLWTMSPSDLQANDLGSLDPIVKFGLR